MKKMPLGYVDVIMESEISPIWCCWLVGSNHQPQHNALFKGLVQPKLKLWLFATHRCVDVGSGWGCRSWGKSVICYKRVECCDGNAHHYQRYSANAVNDFLLQTRFLLRQHDFIAKFPTIILTMNQVKLHGNSSFLISWTKNILMHPENIFLQPSRWLFSLYAHLPEAARYQSQPLASPWLADILGTKAQSDLSNVLLQNRR